MKAWIVQDKNYYDGSVILFTETRGKARAYALTMDEFYGAEFTDISVRRFEEMDKYYNGSTELDYYDDTIRMVLVRDFGWACSDISYECDTCIAKQYCSWYEEDRICW